MLVLGIETSCDETAVALLRMDEAAVEILGDEISSQVSIHAQYGGVVPELAAREHLRALPLLLDKILHDTGVDLNQIEGIGVTSGPGLKGCLLMGCSFAKALALAHACPLLGVNHIEAHVHAAQVSDRNLKYPFLALVVSGGHTEIILVQARGEYTVVARTSDDAAGEAFDKSANLLGLAYPGGAALAALADTTKLSTDLMSRFPLPRVMRESEGFSFSGLKTAIALLVKKHESNLQEVQSDLACVIQHAIVDALLFKLKGAIRDHRVKHITITGGVAANHELRERVLELPTIQVSIPPLRYCMDNAVMIAYMAGLRFRSGQRDDLNIAVRSRWPIEELGMF